MRIGHSGARFLTKRSGSGGWRTGVQNVESRENQTITYIVNNKKLYKSRGAENRSSRPHDRKKERRTEWREP